MIKNKKLLKMASKLYLKTYRQFPQKYYSSLIEKDGEPMIRHKKNKDEIFFWNNSYPKQIVEMYKLEKNLNKMSFLENSCKVSYPNQIVIARFVDLLYNAKLIYSKGLDTPEFDKDVEILNEFVSTHMIRMGIKKKFSIVNKEDVRRREYDVEGRPKNLHQKIADTDKKFKNMDKRFLEIINKNRSKQEKDNANIPTYTK